MREAETIETDDKEKDRVGTPDIETDDEEKDRVGTPDIETDDEENDLPHETIRKR